MMIFPVPKMRYSGLGGLHEFWGFGNEVGFVQTLGLAIEDDQFN